MTLYIVFLGNGLFISDITDLYPRLLDSSTTASAMFLDMFEKSVVELPYLLSIEHAPSVSNNPARMSFLCCIDPYIYSSGTILFSA